MDDVVEQLQRLGLSGYEAKAYVALVGSGEPLNGYEVAKRSGVPRSTVYETLAKLVARSAAFEVRGESPSAVEYVPLPPTTLFGRIRDETEDAIERVVPMLGKLTVRPTVRLTHTLPNRSDVLFRSQDLVAGAREKIRLWAWPEELTELTPALRRADRNGVSVSIVTFGDDFEPVGRVTKQLLASAEEVQRVLGCSLLVLVADEVDVVVAGVLGTEGWGVYSDDPAIAILASEFIELDIASQEFIGWVGLEKLEEFRRQHPEYLRRRANIVDVLRRAAQHTTS